MDSNYFMVRVPSDLSERQVTDALLALTARRSNANPAVTLVSPSMAGLDGDVQRVRALYEADDYEAGDEIRTDGEEYLWQTFSDLVRD